MQNCYFHDVLQEHEGAEHSHSPSRRLRLQEDLGATSRWKVLHQKGPWCRLCIKTSLETLQGEEHQDVTFDSEAIIEKIVSA